VDLVIELQVMIPCCLAWRACLEFELLNGSENVYGHRQWRTTGVTSLFQIEARLRVPGGMR